MDNGWTGGQYSFVRIVLAAFLGGPFLGWGILGLFMAPDLGSAAPQLIACFAGFLLAIALSIGWHDKLASVLLLGCWFLVIRRGTGSWIAPLPVVEALLLFHLVTPAAPYLSWAARGRPDPGGGWRLTGWHVWAARLILVGGLVLVLLVPDAGSPLALLAVLPLAFDPGWIKPRGPGGERVFYDGTCGLCHAAVRFVLAEDRRGTAFRFAPLFGPTFEAELSPDERRDLPDSLVVKTADGRLLTRSNALLHVVAALGGYWRPAAALERLIPLRVRNWQYDQVARHRKRWFGETEAACPLVPPTLAPRLDP